jgi:hypothetical protein
MVGLPASREDGYGTDKTRSPAFAPAEIRGSVFGLFATAQAVNN